MSHQTGIAASDHLKSFLGKAKEGDIRVIKIGITDESLVLRTSCESQGTWEEDYDCSVGPLLDDKDPCYIFYRLDTKMNEGYQWILLFYVPDHAKVRDKMLYASTKASMRTEFGSGLIIDEVYGTVPADVLLEGYRKHKVAESAPPPLSMAEFELEEIKKNEIGHQSPSDKKATVTGISFPLTDEAIDKIVEFGKKSIDFVQLDVDGNKEQIVLTSSGDADPTNLASKIPQKKGSYTLFRYKHTHEGDYKELPVFVYALPGYSCPVKDRMLYSSCKQPLMCGIEEVIGEEIAKNIEIDNPSELTETALYDEVHPKKTIVKPAFSKPKGPAGRAPRQNKKPLS